VVDFDPERFERKYAEYFTDLQQAYRNAFETMNAQFDSELVHAIDQQVLKDSEPFYEAGEFRVELPEDAADRIGGREEVLDRYVEEIEAELRSVFGLDES
jgi:hypothetical protein